jgi:ribosomal protein S18 acetylase RimI-like enzyme
VTVHVRPATPAEYDAVGELTARAYLVDGLVPDGSDYDRTLRRAHDRAAHSELLVAVDEGSDELLGTVSYVRAGSQYAEVSSDGEAEFRMLAVDRAARGRGVGRLLAEACIERARLAGVSRVVICTATNMAPAHRLYESLGFVRLPERDWRPLPSVLLIAYALELGGDAADDVRRAPAAT